MKLDPNGMCDSKASSFWWAAIHDLICHPLLVLTLYSKWAIRFHDWTSWKAWPDPNTGTTRIRRIEILEPKED